STRSGDMDGFEKRLPTSRPLCIPRPFAFLYSNLPAMDVRAELPINNLPEDQRVSRRVDLRLHSLNFFVPKSFVPVGGEDFIQRAADSLARKILEQRIE